MSGIGSVNKILYHKNKLTAYLGGAPIFPGTLELDLTSVCNRQCPQCASTTKLPPYQLSTPIVSRVLAGLERQTRGLILTGGEPTLAPNFAETLRLARNYKFEDVVVVTNGSFLGEEHVATALLNHASAVRVSLYDWNAESCAGLEPTLKRIETLRTRIEKENSPLKIGVSALTFKGNASILSVVAQRAQSAGAHWIYFHPLCAKWDSGAPSRVDQAEVLDQIAECQSNRARDFGVFVFRERYAHDSIEFNGYHASHFLLVIGADGMNYLAPEVKYQRQHIIANVGESTGTDFLDKPERLERIRSIRSTAYPAIGSRHRGMLYNHLIERLVKTGTHPLAESQMTPDPTAFLFPHIL